MVPVCMWHFVQMQSFNLCVCRHPPHSSKSMVVGNCTNSGTACDYLYHSSESVTQKLLCQPASNRTIPLVMGEMQFRVSDPVETSPRKGTWWNTFAGTIFNSQVCWPQLPLCQPCCNLFLKAACECQVDVRLQNTCWYHWDHYNRWQVPCQNVQGPEKVKNFKGQGMYLNLGRWKAVNGHHCCLHRAHLQLMQNFPCKTLSSVTVKNTCISVKLFYLITSANPDPE